MTKENNGLRFGMIGCGEIAMESCKAVLGAKNACITATFDVTQKLAEDMAERAGATPSSTQEELLARDDVDAVIISTPHFLHEPITLAAVKAGKHVLVEKPIACTEEQGQNMVEAAAQANLRLGVCFVKRWTPYVETVRGIIKRGLLGDIISVVLLSMFKKASTYWQGGYTQRSMSDWRTRWESAGGGFLFMNLIHGIDCLRYMMNQEIVEVSALGDTLNSPEGVEVEDMIWAAVRLSGGGVGMVGGSSCGTGGDLSEERIVGATGQIKMSNPPKIFLEEAAEIEGQKIPAGEWTELAPAGGTNDGRLEMMESFARWVAGEEDYLSPGDDALKTLQVCKSIYKDAGIGQAVAT